MFLSQCLILSSVDKAEFSAGTGSKLSEYSLSDSKFTLGYVTIFSYIIIKFEYLIFECISHTFCLSPRYIFVYSNILLCA